MMEYNSTSVCDKKRIEKKRLTADDFNDGGDDNEQLVPVCL